MSFNPAKWVRAGSCEAPYIRKTFTADDFTEARINICGLGFFQLYINGNRVSDHVLVPAWTDYEDRGKRRLLYPINDKFTHRIYYLSYDITSYLVKGKNGIGVLLGNGWYNQNKRNVEGDLWYDKPKLIFNIILKTKTGEEYVVSDETLKWTQSHVIENNIYFGEKHDLSLKLPDFSLSTFDDSSWKAVSILEDTHSIMELQTCPADKKIRTIKPTIVKKLNDSIIYDCGENTVGWVKLEYQGEDGGFVKVAHAEVLAQDNSSLSYDSAGGNDQIQTDTYINIPKNAILEPEFDWHGFRYFQVYGDAKPLEVAVIHTDIPVTSSFDSDNEMLNWLYKTMINTFLCNAHLGVPSDCPHRERLGYTGDGQLVCDTGMLLLGSRLFYKKWMQDIADCQDPNTGHVQHTAPFYGGGGGPGGWGCAIVEVPYRYYRHFGDKEILEKYYPHMVKYIEYLYNHSENGLVVSEEKGGWCLGEWCAPPHVMLPEPFINTYFYIKSMEKMKEIADVLNIPFQFDERIAFSKQALIDTYYDEKNNSFCGSVQGADAFALDLNIGNAEMLSNLVKKYNEAKVLDTGIFGTDVLIKVLFENGFAQTAFDLLTQDGYPSFAHMKNNGATTFWEDWHGKSSHNHPMFGACVKYLYYGLLGIKQNEGSVGFSSVTISPQFVNGLNHIKGEIETKSGKIAVELTKKISTADCYILIDGSIDASFKYNRNCRKLVIGENRFTIEL